MSSLIIFLFVVFFGLFGLVFKKYRSVFGYMMSIGLGIILGKVNSVPDYLLYNNAYNSTVYTTGLKFEYGYEFLSRLVQKFGFNYTEFRLFVGIVGLVLMYRFINRLNVNSIWVMYIYMACSFFIDISQIRNFMMTVFLIMASVTLIEGKNNSTAKSFIYILIGSSFQLLGYFFLLIYLVTFIYRRKSAKIVVSSLFLLGILMFTLPAIRNYTMTITSSILSSGGLENVKLNTYITEQTKLGFLLPWSIILASVLLSILNLNTVKSSNSPESAYVERTHSIFLVVILALPLLTFNIEFYRIYRDFFLLLPISSMYALKIEQQRNNKVLLFLYFIFLMTVHFTITIVPVWSTNVIQVLFN